MNASNKNTFVIVGMSGGVDSSVAALLLKQQGHRVEGLFMRNWEEDEEEIPIGICSAAEDFTDAKNVCKHMGIRLHAVNFATEYWDNVFTYFLDEYKAGRTPNPDVLCNKEIKFKAFLNYAIKLGADYIATGHFARKDKVNNKYRLLKGLDPNKDQSYFLHLINQQQLEKSFFPVGELQKSEIRKLAKEAGFRNCDKKDSTGICFIGERNFKKFLSQYLPAKSGDIETPDGNIIGKHDGLMYYTIGQRQGIGIGGVKNAPESPWYVVKKDLKRNVLIADQGVNNPLLFSSALTSTQLHWISGEHPTLPLHCTAKIRYRQTDQPCIVEKIKTGIAYVTFPEPQRAITPGQSIVFYQDEVCLGGGVIL
ncbi:MAG: tRNA 2-thiouridine(34) synthase MnmA [Gammaproteobacteria bacterium RIFCSPHIGHO2_02_FULL_42_13]|nr:MAG: tRNA 2-thiouridine(34) synthase MnmA [Gammaproteobacteria bacterium RIFCSPHIGHO2_02_FULL_42_13]